MRKFNIPMTIANGRDKAESDLYEANNRINDLLDIVKQKDEAIKILLTAYEKEKETSHYIQSQLDIANAKLVEEKEENKKDIKFKRILADNLKRHIESITIGKSITFPCGWVYKEDLLDLINDIKWEE